MSKASDTALPIYTIQNSILPSTDNVCRRTEYKKIENPDADEPLEITQFFSVSKTTV